MSDLTVEYVKNKLKDIVDDPQGSYNLAGTNFTWKGYYEFLQSLLKTLIEEQSNDDAREADIAIMTFDSEVDLFGNDNGQRML